MNNILHIKWDTGYMDIDMAKFFPCPAGKFNKLRKIIQMDIHAEEVTHTMYNFFREQIPVQEEIYQRESKEFWRYQQTEADSKARIKNKAYPNGVPFTKEELKAEKERQRFYTSHKNEARRVALQAKKAKEWFEGRVDDGTANR